LRLWLSCDLTAPGPFQTRGLSARGWGATKPGLWTDCGLAALIRQSAP